MRARPTYRKKQKRSKAIFFFAAIAVVLLSAWLFIELPKESLGEGTQTLDQSQDDLGETTSDVMQGEILTTEDQEETAVIALSVLTYDELRVNLSTMPTSLAPQAFGGYMLEPSEEESLNVAISEFSANEYSVGFVMMDLSSGFGVSYNADEALYSASSIKGPYVASLVAYNPELIYSQGGTMEGTIDWSSNDYYFSLIATYGRECLRQWCAEAGVENSEVYASVEWFPYFSSRDFAKLWFRNYEYFESGVEGIENVSSWYSSPNNSAIYNVLGTKYTTYSKGGWIAETGYWATCIGGLIYPDDHPYLMVIMSDAPGDMDMLNPLVTALDTIYSHMQQG